MQHNTYYTLQFTSILAKYMILMMMVMMMTVVCCISSDDTLHAVRGISRNLRNMNWGVGVKGWGLIPSPPLGSPPLPVLSP